MRYGWYGDRKYYEKHEVGMSRAEILLETGTNELEILELFLEEDAPDGGKPIPNYFGMNVAKVMQVIESPRLKAPESASHPAFLGVIGLRNMIVPVLSLSKLLGLQMCERNHEVVIITEFSNEITGFLVSGVTDIFRVGWAQVEPPEGFLGRMVTGSVVGTVEMGDHFIQLLDLESILAEVDPESMNLPLDTVTRAKRQYRALVADDSATIRLMLEKMLTAANFSLRIVNNGVEALKVLEGYKEQIAASEKALDELVDVLIADIEMPLMDGFSLTKRVKEDPQFAQLPVILYSSLITDELRHKGDAVGADAQLSKPEMAEMAKRAIELIESRPAA
jgi:two-component system chemotaxis response regulator CheV